MLPDSVARWKGGQLSFRQTRQESGLSCRQIRQESGLGKLGKNRGVANKLANGEAGCGWQISKGGELRAAKSKQENA